MDKSPFLFENRMILLIIFMIPQTVPFVNMEYYTRNTLEFWETWQFFGGIHAFATDSKKHAGFCRRVCPEPAFFGNIRQYRTKSVWRLCTPSACKFLVIFHKDAREYIKYSLRFLFHLTKNLTTHLSHNLCAVLP